MQDANGRLLALARRVAAMYTAGEKARASAVLGSVARRESDAFSDIDLGIYYDTMPTEEEVTAGREALNATHLVRLPGGSDEAIADIFTVDGVECQVIHCTAARIEADLGAVLDTHRRHFEVWHP